MNATGEYAYMLHVCPSCGVKSMGTDKTCGLCGNRDMHPIGFQWVSNTIRQLGAGHALCTLSNPTSSAPPFWPPLEDSAEGRAELAKRIRKVFALNGDHIHGDERAHLIKEWVKRTGLQ